MAAQLNVGKRRASKRITKRYEGLGRSPLKPTTSARCRPSPPAHYDRARHRRSDRHRAPGADSHRVTSSPPTLAGVSPCQKVLSSPISVVLTGGRIPTRGESALHSPPY